MLDEMYRDSRGIGQQGEMEEGDIAQLDPVHPGTR